MKAESPVSCSKLGLRLLTRGALAGVGFSLWVGIFSSAGLGCGSLASYRCGAKDGNRSCAMQVVQSTCEQDSACQWRVGCASTCKDAQTIQECGMNPSCGVSAGNCFGSGCKTAAADEITSREQCPTSAFCAWEPACWDAPNTDCTPDLDESECNRRNCRWEKQNGQL